MEHGTFISRKRAKHQPAGLLETLAIIHHRAHNAVMKQLCVVLVVAATLAVPARPKNGQNPFIGRWDITVTTPNATYPNWLELVDKDGSLEVRLQPRAGSVRPVTGAKLEGSTLSLVISPATESGPAFTWELSVKDNQLTGVLHRGTEVRGRLIGVRAPDLKHKPPKAWTDPEPLFNGKDLTGWEPGDPSDNHWVVRDGELINEQPGSNLRTTQRFDDFKLHMESNCPDGGNTGVYLRGRYHVQIEYAPPGVNDKLHGIGSIYGYLAPAVELPRKPGEWESYDVTLVGRYVTLVRDGVTIIDNQEIPGITGGALDSNEAAPGGLNLQGHHTGGIRFRNITIAVPKR